MSRVKVVPAAPEREVEEGIIAISISYVNKSASVGRAYGHTIDGEFVPDMSTAVYEEVDFNKLMQGQPEWAPNKPAGSFRLDDVFQVLDRQHQKQDDQPETPDKEKGKK